MESHLQILNLRTRGVQSTSDELSAGLVYIPLILTFWGVG